MISKLEFSRGDRWTVRLGWDVHFGHYRRGCVSQCRWKDGSGTGM